MDRLVRSNGRCSPSSFSKFRRLLAVQGNAGGTQSPFACDQELSVAAALAKSVLDDETPVVERLWRRPKEGRCIPLRRNKRMVADIVQLVLVVFKCCKVSARSVAASQNHPTDEAYIRSRD